MDKVKHEIETAFGVIDDRVSGISPTDIHQARVEAVAEARTLLSGARVVLIDWSESRTTITERAVPRVELRAQLADSQPSLTLAS